MEQPRQPCAILPETLPEPQWIQTMGTGQQNNIVARLVHEKSIRSGLRHSQTQRSRTFIMPVYNTLMWGGLAGL